MNIVKVALLGVLGTLLAVQFKGGKSEYGIYMGAGISLVILFSILSRLDVIIDTMKQIGDYVSLVPSYISTLLKMLGITYIAEFAAVICKDAGYQTIASQIEIFAKLTILALSMPILLALLETIQAFLS
ncbi:MAG: SpoIIIAC/SpoIIIAD family protein [Lachnospiraceae bacterium]